MDPERHRIKGVVVDRGGIRGPDGKLENQEHVGQRQGKGKGVTFSHIPPACDETTIEQALVYLEKLQDFPDSAS